MLALAAHRADIIGINPSLHSGAIDEHAGPTATAEATDRKLDVVRDAAGERFDSLELRERWGISYISLMGGSAEQMAPVVERLAGR